MKLLDRLMIYAYLKAYLICLISLLSLYVVVDMFTNIEDFAHGHDGLVPIVKHIGTYYGYSGQEALISKEKEASNKAKSYESDMKWYRFQARAYRAMLGQMGTTIDPGRGPPRAFRGLWPPLPGRRQSRTRHSTNLHVPEQSERRSRRQARSGHPGWLRAQRHPHRGRPGLAEDEDHQTVLLHDPREHR